MTKTAALVVLLVAAGATWAQDYCSLCADHTMCIFKGVGPKCNPLISSGVSAAEAKQIVDVHNELRARVALGKETSGRNGAQPPAANMRKMEWDAELSMLAQRWADQCNFGRDKCRKVSRFYVGQNAYILGSSAGDVAVSWKKVVNFWYDGVNAFDSRTIPAIEFSSGTRHYTQLVWAETSKVGCGYVKFQEGTWYRHLHVCNYGPAGNVLGEPLYREGRACSKCPLGSTTCPNGLCATEGDLPHAFAAQ